MTLSPNFSRQILIAVMALVYTTLSFGAAVTPAPAMARDSGNYYRAELAQPAEERVVIAAGIAWSCVGTSCVAGKGNSRPVITCARLAREVGTIENFTSKGELLAEDKLERCNR